MFQVFINVIDSQTKRKEDNQDTIFPLLKKDIFVSNNMAEKAPLSIRKVNFTINLEGKSRY